MEVTCGQCGTRYRVDEARLGAGPGQGRCSRCGHIMELTPAGMAPEGSGAEGVAGAGLTPPGVAGPDGKSEKTSSGEPNTAFPADLAAPPAARGSSGWLKNPAVLTGALLLGFILGGLSWWFLENRGASSPGPGAAPPAKTAETPGAAKPGGPAVGGLKADWTLSNAKGGRLLVLQGEVENPPGQIRGPLRLKAVLKDREQRLVQEKRFYGGVIFSAEDLKNLDPAAIEGRLQVPAGRPGAAQIPPAKALPFMAVFFGVPQDLRGYGFEVQVTQEEAGSPLAK